MKDIFNKIQIFFQTLDSSSLLRIVFGLAIFAILLNIFTFLLPVIAIILLAFFARSWIRKNKKDIHTSSQKQNSSPEKKYKNVIDI